MYCSGSSYESTLNRVRLGIIRLRFPLIYLGRNEYLFGMKGNEIIRLRLQNQLLSNHAFDTVPDVVRWLGAVQAQDYLGSLWAIGSRLEHGTESEVEKAIVNRTIVRSWPMRGTIHFTAPENLRWMLKLLAPRIIKKATPNYKLSGLDNKVFSKSAKIVERALEADPVMTRDDLYQVLERAKIKTDNTRGLHILGWMAQNGIICQANRKGKQFTFTLLDNWIPPCKAITDDEAFEKLAVMYFRSHGPATVRDFAWWTGFNLTEAKKAITLAGEKLKEQTFENESYWLTEELQTNKSKAKVYLLPSYDEYTVGYKDRSLFLSEDHKDAARNGIFSPVILIGGQIAGTWKRTVGKNNVVIDTEQFRKFSPGALDMLKKAVKRYKKFLGVD
jgi:hypothetical protein